MKVIGVSSGVVPLSFTATGGSLTGRMVMVTVAGLRSGMPVVSREKYLKVSTPFQSWSGTK